MAPEPRGGCAPLGWRRGGVCTHIFLVTGWFLGGTGRLELELKVDPLVDDGGAMNRGEQDPTHPDHEPAQQPRQPCLPGFDFTAPLFAAFSPQPLRRTLTLGSAHLSPSGTPTHTFLYDPWKVPCGAIPENSPSGRQLGYPRSRDHTQETALAVGGRS